MLFHRNILNMIHVMLEVSGNIINIMFTSLIFIPQQAHGKKTAEFWQKLYRSATEDAKIHDLSLPIWDTQKTNRFLAAECIYVYIHCIYTYTTTIIFIYYVLSFQQLHWHWLEKQLVFTVIVSSLLAQLSQTHSVASSNPAVMAIY